MKRIKIEFELDATAIERLDKLRNEFRKVSRSTMVEILIDNARPEPREICPPQPFKSGPDLDEPSDW